MSDIQDAINAIAKQFEGIQKALEAAEAQLAKTKAENRTWDDNLVLKRQEHGKLMSELEAKRVAAEKAAEENGRRIALNNNQVAELDSIRKSLDDRANAIAVREKAYERIMQEYATRLSALDKREAEITIKGKEIDRRYAKMKEAVS